MLVASRRPVRAQGMGRGSVERPCGKRYRGLGVEGGGESGIFVEGLAGLFCGSGGVLELWALTIAS